MPALAEALHRYHNGEIDQMVTAILSNDWSVIDPAAASAELTNGITAENRPAYIQPYGGLGFCYADVVGSPAVGMLDETTDPKYEWLYLFTAEELHVFRNDCTGRQWHSEHTLTFDTLKRIADAPAAWDVAAGAPQPAGQGATDG
ncbi:hypothetical protein M8C13_07310 [Crossiella sp. SN42]|uniref:hypothetical protein n=1 Tax=Crossiella sp. SN42 TaxID=2944808 RepID=UPI00207D2C21|nr:hypothetical protein [Crossiella sp. SN42]MCO1575565.1 hypothetical protein [Crossiella sp. SN42]